MLTKPALRAFGAALLRPSYRPFLVTRRRKLYHRRRPAIPSVLCRSLTSFYYRINMHRLTFHILLLDNAGLQLTPCV
jgi:hypothetical protein